MFKEIVSEKPSNNLEKTELDYQQLEAEKRAIFARIMENKDFSEEERDFLVARVFEYSIEDGLEIADALSLDREARTEVITRYAFMKKHGGFVSKLRNKLVEYSAFAGEQDEDEIANLSAELSRDIKNPVQKGKNRFRKAKIVFGEEAETFLKQIDDYYTHFLRFRGVKEKEVPTDKRSKGEKTAEGALIQDIRALEPHYYTGPIKDLVGTDHPILRNPLIKQSELTELFAHLHLSLDDEDTKKKLEQARYKPLHMIWDILHKDGEKELKAEIIADLKSRGYKDGDFELVYDEQKRQYRILNKTPEHQEFKKENLRLVKEIPTVFEMKLDDPYFSRVKRQMEDHMGEATINKAGSLELRPEIINIGGQIFQKFNAFSNYGFIIYPDGSRSKIYLALQNLRKVKRGLAFTINDYERRPGDNNFQIVVNERRIREDDTWDSITNDQCVEANDGSIYYVANQFDYDRQISKYAIFKDDQILHSFPYGQRPDDLSLINGKLLYTVTENRSSENKSSVLFYGDEVLGPYKDIKFPENPDGLIFAAERKDGEKIIFFNGVEHPIKAGGGICSVVKVSDKIFLLLQKVIEKRTKENNFSGKYLQHIVDQDGNIISGEYSSIRNLLTLDSKLFYSNLKGEELKGEEPYQNQKLILHWGEEAIDVTDQFDKFKMITPIGVLNGDLFYSGEGKLYSFNSGLINLGDNVQVEKAEIYNGEMMVVVKEGDLYKIFKWSPEFQLNDEEKRRLELLNTLKSESLEVIDAYFKKYYPEEVKKGLLERLKDTLEHSKDFAKSITAMIKEAPALFLQDIGAKKDDLTDANIDQFVSSLFPDLKTNLERAKDKARYERNRRDRDSSIRSCFDGGRESSEFNDGDPKEEDSPEVLKLREPISEFLSTGIYGQYNNVRKTWEQVGFPLSQTHIGPTREITAEIPVVKYMENAILPKCLDGVIIAERVKGVKSDGEEIQLVVSFNTLGEARVDIPDGIEKIVYSQTLQDLPTVPTDVNAQEYEDFKNNYAKRFGIRISEKIVALPEELRIFIDSLKNKSPVEKIEEIESFVRSIGYYDFDNREMQGLKKGKSLEENFSIMAQRIKELRKRKPEEAEKLAHKKYAGVCSDFAKLTTALLREAGIVSGMVMGLQPSGDEISITTKNAHAVAYALWPAEDGKAKAISLDGTPAGMSEAEEKLISGIRQKSLKERRKQFDEEKGKVVENADKLLKELEDLIANLDEEGIKKLKNGKLEKALNAILGQVRESHLAVVDRVLNASRYAGFDVSKLIKKGSIDDELALRRFLESEIARERNVENKGGHFKGEDLLKSIEGFILAYEKDKGVGERKKAFDIVERIFDISKNSLDPIESRSAIAVITYLRSEHMTK